MSDVAYKFPVARAGWPNTERRRADRIQTDRPAYLRCWSPIGDEAVALVPCVIRDASTTGAMLSLNDGAARAELVAIGRAFERFRLQIPSIGIEVCCAIVWRKNGQIGVRYMSPARLLSDTARDDCCLSGTHELPRPLETEFDLRAAN